MIRAPVLDGVEQVGAVGRLLGAARGRRSPCSRPSPRSCRAGSQLRLILANDQPRRSAARCIAWVGRLYSEHSSLTLIRSQTPSRWRSKASVATSSSPCSSPTGARTQSFVRSELVQLMTVPPPSPDPACRVTFMSAGRRGSAAPVEVLPRPQLELVEVGVGVVAADLEHHDARGRQRPSLAAITAAAGAGADDHRVGVDHACRRPATSGSIGLASACVRGRDRARVAERRPGRVPAGLGVRRSRR